VLAVKKVSPVKLVPEAKKVSKVIQVNKVPLVKKVAHLLDSTLSE
jgi:hypothetical protein